MTLRQISVAIDLRLNKGASSDYDNIWKYQKQEAFNKGVTDVVRRMKRGKNQTQDGDEETDMRVDDLQVLLKQGSLTVRDKGNYAQTNSLPADYLYYKRITPIVSKGDCHSIPIKSHFGEEANVDNPTIIPSFKFEETFHTLIGNKVHIYHNKDFTVDKANIVYYRKPIVYDFKKLDTVVEFNDGMCSILVDEAVKIIASDIESVNQKNLAQERGENNN